MRCFMTLHASGLGGCPVVPGENAFYAVPNCSVACEGVLMDSDL